MIMAPYYLYGPTGELLAGEAALSENMLERCVEVDGYIKDEATGEVVYPTDEED